MNKLFTIGAMALTLLGVCAASAWAGTNEQITTEGGSVVFLHQGERLSAHDERRDGFGVRATITWNDDYGGHTVSVTDYSSRGGAAKRNLSFREGTVLWLDMCYTKNRRSVKCSLTQRATA